MKRKMLRMLSVLMVLGVIAGCTGQQSSGSAGGSSDPGKPAESQSTDPGKSPTVEPDTLIVAVNDEGTTFDPFNYADLNDGFLIRETHEPLAYLDKSAPDGLATPVLAESWEYPDDQTIILHLRKGVKFQNGDEMKASDVVFSIKMSRDKGLLNPDNWKNLDIDNAKIIDDYTLQISTFEPSSFTFAWLLTEMVSIVSERAYTEAGENYGRNPNGGTGPYILTDWVAGDRVTFVRNEDYWGTPPQYKNMILRFIVEGTARTFAVESGDVDFAYACPTADLSTLEALDGYTVHRQKTSGVNYLWFNNKDQYLQDVRVRKALSYALDLQTMVPIAWNNIGSVADSMFGPACTQKIVPDTVYTQNMEKAKQLMAEAGYADGFNLKIIITDMAARKNIAEMMKNVWAELNVNLEIEVLELSTILETIRSGNYQLTILAEGGFHGDAYRPYFHSEGVNNYCNYSNPRIDELFDLAGKSQDHDEQMKYYSELQNTVAEEVPVLPLQYDEKIHAMRKGLHYSVDETATYNFMDGRFYYVRYD